MSAPKKTTVDTQHELAKLITLIELPLTHIRFITKPDEVVLSIQSGEIGRLLYQDSKGPGSIRYYYSQIEFLERLDWNKVLRQEYDKIMVKVHVELPEAAALTTGKFKIAYVKNAEGFDIGTVQCTFRDDQWVVLKTA